MTDERRLSTSDIANAMDRRDEQTDEGARAEGARPQEGAPRDVDDRPSPLFADEELTGYRARWSGIQTGFVDEPRKAVEEADTLVAELMKRLADSFAEERRKLEGEWERSDRVSTEDLRIAMRRYRSFFERLLSI
jgi:enoyl-CoA hydratase/carnithine racemase